MAHTALRREEGIGLALAAAAHVALVALLVLRPPSAPVVVPPERMAVTLSDDVGLTSTSPNPSAQAAPAEAPVLGEPPAEQAEAAPQPQPAPVQPQPAPQPVPQPTRRAEPPKPVVKPAPAPTPRPLARPAPQPVQRPAATPPKPAQKAPAATPPRPATAPATRAAPQAATGTAAPRGTAATPPRNAGGSRIGADFLKGVQGARTNGPAQTPPAATIGPAVRSALAGAISRQLKPRWVAPQGAEADKLVTFLTWNLNRDGSLAGAPRVVRQDGITDANRPQAQRHAEQAIRAVQLAAPFNLPDEYYDAWKRVAEFRFDRKLSQ